MTLLIFLQLLIRSELAQRVGINEIAESMMAFNTNYKDTGLFGVYAVAKVSSSNYILVFYSSTVVCFFICAPWSPLCIICFQRSERKFCDYFLSH